MSRQIRPAGILIAALAIAFSPLAKAWTPYGHGPYGPGYQPVDPGNAQPYPDLGVRPYAPPPPLPGYAPGGYGDTIDGPYGAPGPDATPGGPPAGSAAPAGSYSGFGPGTDRPWGPPGIAGRGFGRPSGFRLSREASEDAYTLVIELDGMAPDEVQVRTQGQWILLSRERTEQQVQKDSFDDGRGFTRSFSYSSGTASRRLSVPRDGDLSAMSREDGEGVVRIRIPRRGR